MVEKKKNLKQLIKKNDMTERFILLGKKTNPYPYIKKCDIYCQPSRYEGKAVTVREAQILGKPVVITNFLTSKSQVQDGFDGLITPMGVNGIVNGIKKLIEDNKLKERIVANTLTIDYGNTNEIESLYKIICR